ETLVVAVRRQWILIEEAVAALGDAVEESIVENALEEIDVARVLMQQEHPLIPQDVAVRRAGLVPRAQVRKLVRRSELLVEPAGSDGAGDVGLSMGCVFPDAVDGLGVLRRPRERGDVGQRNVEIRGANGMADRFVLRDDRRLVLRVGPVGRVFPLTRIIVLATLVEEEPREPPVALVAGLAIEAHQADLETLVTRAVGLLAGP